MIYKHELRGIILLHKLLQNSAEKMSILKEATSGFEVQGKELAFFCYISNAYAFKS